MTNNYRPIVLIILDGWGLSPSWGGNVIAMNNPPNMNYYWRNFPHKILKAHAPQIQKYRIIGDSRLGHSTIAAGRFVKQDLEIISESIENGSFNHNKQLIEAINYAKKNNSNLHLIGMMSTGGVHAYISHLYALLELCHRQNFQRVYLDLIADGIDSDDGTALEFVLKINKKLHSLGFGEISSLVGRSIAMDRGLKWLKIRQAYEMLVEGKGDRFSTAEKAVATNYRHHISDHSIRPALIKTKTGFKTIKDNDSIILFNFRPDRTKKLYKILTDPNFKRFFWRPVRLKNILVTTFTRLSKNQQSPICFERQPVSETIGEILAKYQKTQLRIAESEKKAHVTYFFNGGRFEKFPGETDLIIPSPAGNYAYHPEMSAERISQDAVNAISQKIFDFILINFANVDLMGHTGNLSAASAAVKIIDKEIKKIVDAALKVNGCVIITADHGNAEEIVKVNPNRPVSLESQHTFNPVPLIVIGNDFQKDAQKGVLMPSSLSLSKIMGANDDLTVVAPTILELMGIPKPQVMTGRSVFRELD